MSSFNRKQVAADIASMEAMGMSQSQISEKLNEQKSKTPTGLDWNQTRLSNFKVTQRKHKRPAKAKAPAPAKKPPRHEMPQPDAAWIMPILGRRDWSAEKKVRVLSACLET